MTIDGFCDHDIMSPDEEIHQHYTDLLYEGAAILYGRKTYQLMEFWRTILEQPLEVQSMNDFARAIDRIPKIVFSHTLQSVDWQSAQLADLSLEETVLELKQQPRKDIFVGSRSLVNALTNLKLIDEYQLCVHPVVASKGLPLLDQITDRTVFELLKTKTFTSGAIILYYKSVSAI